MKQANTNEKITDNSKSLKNKLIIPLLLLSLALIFSFGVSAVSAVVTDTSSVSSVIYVNNSGGSDSNNGTSWEWAKKSISNATGTVTENGTVYIADGTYTGENNTGITIDKNMAISGQSQTDTIIDGNNMAQLFLINPGISVIFQNLTFTNGNSDIGGGILNYGDLTVTGCTFTGNTANWYGSAITNDGTLTVIGSTFTNNTSSGDGGAIANGDFTNYGTLTVIGSTFTGNTAHYFSGGAISNYYSSSTVIGSTFTNNTAAYDGGAISNYHSYSTITGSTFTNNTANVGGAISNYYSSSTVTGNTFTNNTAVWGGAVYNYYGDLTVNYCRIVGNTADTAGNAIYNYSGEEIQPEIQAESEQTLNAENNWWGSNNPDFTTLISGMAYPTYWLYMTLTASPTTINNTQTSLITVSFNNLFNGTTRTDLNPATGHIPDGTPVNFQTDLGTIGCKSIDKTTVGGIATALLTATELAGTAHLNATTDDQTLYVNVTINPKSNLYLTVTPSKNNPVPGDTVLYTIKIGNTGPDTAKDVVMTYTIPAGLELVNFTQEAGYLAPTYNPATRTITWILGDMPVKDPYLWLNLRIVQPGQYLINPALTTSTYDPTLSSSIQSVTVSAAAQAKAASRTIGMQDTGLPLAGLILAILAVLGGFVTPRRK